MPLTQLADKNRNARRDHHGARVTTFCGMTERERVSTMQPFDAYNQKTNLNWSTGIQKAAGGPAQSGEV